MTEPSDPGSAAGLEAAAELRKLDPAIPVFVATGYAGGSIMADPAAHGFAGSVGKPFTLEELSRLLEGVGKTAEG